MSTVSIGIIMMLVAIALAASFLRYKSRTSERRMMRMMQHHGLDPQIARQGDAESIIREIRRRCSKCQFEGHCERWLNGKESGDGSFCPNARVFEELAR
jgi:hypothetical protein